MENGIRYGLVFGTVLVSLLFLSGGVRAEGPYIQLEAGVLARDVAEEDPSLVGFKFEGEAVSTRLIAKVGIELFDLVDLYVQGGGADLSVEEFNDYDADLAWAYGGGIRLNLYRSPYRDRFTLFVELSTLRVETDDEVETEISGSPEIVEETIEWNEYAVLLGASGRADGFRPYGGIRLSRLDGTDKIRSPDFSADLDLEEEDNFGIFFGLDLFLDRSEKTAVNFEVSLFDQDSFRAAIRRAF
jgi:hypothetical protein